MSRRAGEKSAPDAANDAARSRRAKRQSELLDQGLKETFPASDPVSIFRVD